MEHGANGDVFIYTVSNDDAYLSLGNNIIKIYYSKKFGFIKFVMQTHWFPVEMNRDKISGQVN